MRLKEGGIGGKWKKGLMGFMAIQAVEVYERLVSKSPEDPPDLVIGGESARSGFRSRAQGRQRRDQELR